MTQDWRGVPVLVTGASGFIGSHLTEELVRRGASVRAFSHYNALNDWGWLEALDRDVLDSVDVFRGDIRDLESVTAAMQGREVVFHLSSLVGIPYSYRAPDSYLQTNTGGALNVLIAARQTGARRVVETSTSEVYGTALYVPIDEKHPLQPQSPYAASKIAADMFALSYYLSFDVPVAVARPFNTYGPRQSARAVIPTIIGQLAESPPRLELGVLSAVRDFNYVEDTVAGFLAVARCDKALGEAVNLGSGAGVSIGEIAEMVMKIMGVRVEIVTDESRMRPEKSEVRRLLCDNTRAREWMGWQPRVPVEEGLRRTVEWFLANRHRYKARLFNV
jgi:dTDP-glucose 4,6-dehydratase